MASILLQIVSNTIVGVTYAEVSAIRRISQPHLSSDHRTVRRLAASLLPLVNEHPSLVLLVLSIFLYILHVLSGYPLQVGTDAIPRDESADGRQMPVFAFFY